MIPKEQSYGEWMRSNPEIYTKAELISKEDALGFAEWINNISFYSYHATNKLWYGSNSRLTTEELYTLYINLTNNL